MLIHGDKLKSSCLFQQAVEIESIVLRIIMLTSSDFKETRKKFLEWAQTTPYSIHHAGLICIHRVAEGAPLPWEENK